MSIVIRRYDTIAFGDMKLIKPGHVWPVFENKDHKELIDANFPSRKRLAYPGERLSLVCIRTQGVVLGDGKTKMSDVFMNSLYFKLCIQRKTRCKKRVVMEVPAGMLDCRQKPVNFYLPPFIDEETIISATVAFYGWKFCFVYEDGAYLRVICDLKVIEDQAQ